MVKVERTPTPPASLADEKKKASGCYRKSDVLLQLQHDFHGKCYLCEINELQSIHVEHLYPHGGHNKELEFDWNNLFLSCPHCNLVKTQKKYTGMVLDCCKNDPEAAVNHLFENGHVAVHALQNTPESKMTAELLTECFEKTDTGVRILECQTRINALNRTMNMLYKQLMEYRRTSSDRNLRVLCAMLSRTYKFAGFTRAYVRGHLKDYPDLAEYVQL